MKSANILQYLLVDTAANALLKSKSVIENELDMPFAEETLNQAACYLVAIRRSIHFDPARLTERSKDAFDILDHQTTIVETTKQTKPTIH